MARTDRRHIALGAIGLIILAIVLPPFINVNRYRARIAAVTSNALGRPVSIGNISLNLLPQPGFTLENFVVGDDPAFRHVPRALLHRLGCCRGGQIGVVVQHINIAEYQPAHSRGPTFAT